MATEETRKPEAKAFGKAAEAPSVFESADAPPPSAPAPGQKVKVMVDAVVPAEGGVVPTSLPGDFSETVPGGRYVQDAKIVGGKPHGGKIVDAEGRVLATFADDAVNTGRIEDGQITEDGKKSKELAKAAGKG